MLRRADENGEGIISLVRETADGLGRLIADHIKLARVEMVADAKEYGRNVALLSIAGLMLLVGYGFGWIAAALAVARLFDSPLALPLSFLAVAVLHLVGGAIGLAVVLGKLRKARPLDDTVNEVNRSVATLTAQVATGRAPPP